MAKRFRALHTDVASSVQGGEIDIVSTAYADSGLSLSFVKYLDDSALVFDAAVTGLTWNVSTPASITLAILCNGTDYPIASAGVDGAAANNGFQSLSGFYKLTGLAKGSYTIKLRHKIGTTAGGAYAYYVSGINSLSMKVTETL
jgi:hypothetical protein